MTHRPSIKLLATLLVSMFFIFSCQSGKGENSQNEGSINNDNDSNSTIGPPSLMKPRRDQTSNTIEIEPLLTEQQNTYLLSLKDSTLELCTDGKLFTIWESLQSNEFTMSMKNQGYSDSFFVEQRTNEENTPSQVFTKGNSKIFLKRYVDNQSDTTFFIGSESVITDVNLTFQNQVKIGMNKKAFFNSFFKLNNDSIYNAIQIISVSENESGETEVKYHFDRNTDTLQKITF